MFMVSILLLVGVAGVDRVSSRLHSSEPRWALFALAVVLDLASIILWSTSSGSSWVIAVVLGVLAAYRIFNRVRLYLSRQDPVRLQRSFVRSVGLLTTSSFVSQIASLYLQPGARFLVVIGYTLAFGAAVFAAYHRLIYRLPALKEHLSDKELPSVSILVPARNETRELVECLESLVAIDYPKLEILVLDDCSTNEKTSQIIKSFARSGVRFISGEPPADEWLGKNNAYQALYAQASSDWLFFMGTDLRLGKHSLRNLMARLAESELHMVSLMPLRDVRSGYGLTMPLRYWLEFALPRELLRRPPVLSTAWVVRSEALKPFGGFQGISRSIIPERHIAASLGADYAFWLAEPRRVWLSTAKDTPARYHTALRQRYPQLKRRVERVAWASIVMAGLFASLVVAIAWHPLLGLGLYALLVFGVTLPGLTYYGVGGLVRGLLAPLLIVQEVGLMNYSMFKYELGTISWRGRNVCLPVMRVYDKLPDID